MVETDSPSFERLSYDRHIAHTRQSASEVPSVIASPQSIDAHRHARMYEYARPLIRLFPESDWLTVGDTGADAHYLKQLSAPRVTCSSLATGQIEELRARGLVHDFDIKALNAEAIDLPERSVDFVFCKEAYHHFPRPPLAYYELLRVCRRAVVYIEPAEPVRWGLLDQAKVAIKSLLRGKASIEHEFEDSGNYLYRLSQREMTKQATALQLGHVAYAYFNDFWHAKLSQRPMSERLPRALFGAGILTQNLLCRLRLMNYGLIVYVVFKDRLHADQVASLTRAGFRVREIPRNPYLLAGMDSVSSKVQ